MSRFSMSICMAACAAALSAFADDASVTAWADDAIAVDAVQSEFKIVTGTASLWCSPDWCTGGTNVSGSTYSLKVVSDPDTANAVTSSVSALDYSSACEVPYSGSGYVRFLLSAEAGGAPVGKTLVRDVSFGVMSGLSSAVAYDNRASSLQEAVRRGGAINLEYLADEPGKYVILLKIAHPEIRYPVTADVTIRRRQKFRPRPGQSVQVTINGKTLSAPVKLDKSGLLTVPKVTFADRNDVKIEMLLP